MKALSTNLMFLEKSKKPPFSIYIYNGEFHYEQESRIFFLPGWLVG